MEFVAIDVETANPDMASICQIGVAKFQNGKLIDEWSSLLNPEDDFSTFNKHIHGISEEDVVDAPKFPDIVEDLSQLLTDTITVCHSPFDKVAIGKATDKYSLNRIETTWLDSARVARRAWKDSANGYGLKAVCEIIGYKFKHHDALEDAKASAQIINAAVEKTELSVEDWLKRVGKPVSSKADRKKTNPEGELFGEVVVFTGALEIQRSEAADIAADLGCVVKDGVTKATTLLVVGDQDIRALSPGQDKSNKHRKAEELIEKGQEIRILQESDFKDLVKSY